MKFLYALITMCAAGSLVAMDYNHNGCLGLILNKDYVVKGFHAQDMNPPIDQSYVLGKNIFDAIKISEDGKKLFSMGLLKAIQQNRKVSIAYTYSLSKDRQALATITPIMKKTSDRFEQKNNFFVQIQELDNQ